jgi:hypothetical protein
VPSYSFLKTDIINTIENNSSEFEEQIPFIVEKAEDRLIKELDDPGLDNYSTFSFTASDPVVSLPADALVVRNVNYTTSVSTAAISANSKINLLQRTYEYAIDYFPYASASTGTPRYYSRKTNTQIYIVPTPASAVSGEIQYTRRPLALASATGTSVTTSNYFSEFCYNALFAASMVESNYFIKDLQAVATWEGKYKNSIDALRNQSRRMRQDDMQVAASPAGGPNPVIQGAN